MSTAQEDLVGAVAPIDRTDDARFAPTDDDDTIDVMDADDGHDTDIEPPFIGELPPPSPEDVDLSVESIVARANRADAQLRRWRTTSVDRNLTWQQEQALQLEEESRRKGWFLLGSAMGVTVGLLGIFGVMLARDIASVPVVDKVAVAPVTALERPVVPAKAQVVEAAVAPVVGEAEEAPVAAVAPESAPEPVAVVAADKQAAPTPVRPVAKGSGPTVIGDARSWQRGDYTWSEAVVTEVGVELAWFDETGREALDRVPCAGRVADGFLCKSGRSARRLAWAMDQGAKPGLWTVKACGADGVCTTLGTVDVAR